MSIQVKNLCIGVDSSLNKKARNTHAENIIKNVSFTAPSRQITTIIGANGAGKSTLLKAIVGDIRISSGEILLHGKSINPKETDQNKARCLSFLPQLSLLNFPYTVKEVVSLGRIPHKTGDKIDTNIIDECLETVEMQSLSQRLYPQLSGGEKQRVQIARVLAQVWREQDCRSPRVLLLDEPNSSLDLGHQQILMHFLQRFTRKNVSILMVLHNLNTAANYSDHLIAMNQGKVIATGSPEKIIHAPLIEELFGVTCQIMTNSSTGKPIILEE